MKKIISVLLSVMLLSPSTLVYAQEKPLSLKQVQQQNRKHWKQLKEKFGPQQATLVSLAATKFFVDAKNEAAELTKSLKLREENLLPLSREEYQRAVQDLGLLKTHLRNGEFEKAYKIITEKMYYEHSSEQTIYRIIVYNQVYYEQRPRQAYLTFKDIVTHPWAAEATQDIIDQFPMNAAWKGYSEAFFVTRQRVPVFENASHYAAYDVQGAVVHYNKVREILQTIDQHKGTMPDEQLIKMIQERILSTRPYCVAVEEHRFIRDLVINYENLKDETFLSNYLQNLPKRSDLGVGDAMKYNLQARLRKWDVMLEPGTRNFKLLIKGTLLPALVLLVGAGVVLSEMAPDTEDLKLLSRLQNNIGLFFEASDEELAELEQHKLSKEFCYQMAEGLAQAAKNPHVTDNLHKMALAQEQKQQQLVKQDLTRSLRSVSAR